MDIQEIRAGIKKAINTVTGIDVTEIRDDSSYNVGAWFRQSPSVLVLCHDLDLDSLSIFEIVFDVEVRFDILATEEELKAIRTIDDTVRLVQQYVLTEVD